MRKYQFQRQITLKNIVVAVIVTVFMTAIFLGYVIYTGWDSFEEQVDVQLQGVVSQLDNTLQTADGVALQLAANSLILESFEAMQTYEGENNYFVDNPAVNYALTQHMSSYMLKRSSYKRICLFDRKQNLSYMGNLVNYGFLKKDCPDTSLFTDTAAYFDGSGKARLFRIDLQDPYVRDPAPTISVLREIRDYQLLPSKSLGYVQVQISPESFSYDELLAKDTECCLLSQQGHEVLQSYGENLDAASVQRLLEYPDGTVRGGIYIVRRELPEYGITVFIAAKNRNLIRNLASIFMWTLLLLISVIVIICAGQAQIVRKTMQPVVQMCDMLEGIQIDENLQEIPLVADQEVDELRQLNVAFDSLVKNLKLSMERAMVSRVNEIQSQMFAMQSQMNPHFIHNILTIISAMAGTEEEKKIPEICGKLSDMIRYSTNYSDSYGSLKEEIRHAENYLELMKVRYEDRFRYTMAWVGDTQDCQMPRFIIQPLIENCFSHGFNRRPFPWEIVIRIFASEECWEIRIRDNGGGIAPGELAQLKQELEQMRRRDMGGLMQELRIGGLSVRNVYARLYIAYGEQMIFELESNDSGTLITVGGKYENTGDGGGGRASDPEKHLQDDRDAQ